MTGPEDHVATLQGRIREHLDALRPLVPDSADYARAAAAVLEATAELIEYEEKLPVLIDEPRHRISVAAVRWGGLATAAVGLLLALCVVPDWISVWWLVLLVPVVVAGLWVARLPVHPPGGPHQRQRVGAVAVAASSPVTALTVFDVLLPPWAAVVTVALAGGGCAYLAREPEPARGPRDAGEAAPSATSGERRESDPDAPTPPSGLVLPP